MNKHRKLKLSRETLYILRTADLPRLAGGVPTGPIVCPQPTGVVLCPGPDVQGSYGCNTDPVTTGSGMPDCVSYGVCSEWTVICP